MAKSDKRTPKEASKLFESMIKASVKDNPKPTTSKKKK